MGKLLIKVPATTANLGAGFDTLGLALTLYNEFYIEKSSSIEIETVPKNLWLEKLENNLFIQVLKSVFDYLGNSFNGVKVKQINNVPVARGLGSSATAIVAGIITGFSLNGKEPTDEDFFKIAYKFEPHPDNLVPAWKGGFVTALIDKGKTYYNQIYFPEDLKAVVVIPEFELSTEDARKVLPDKISLSDGIFNVQRVALFISALQNKRYDLLKIAMDDRFHQPYRKKLIPNFDKVIENAYSEGALGVSLSGAGSTILALADNNFEEIGKAMVKGFEEANIKSDYKVLEIDKKGATLSFV